MRQAIGALMARSKREIPHYYLQTQIDMSRALAWLEEENLERSVPERLLPSALLLSAVAGAVAATPAMNGFWVDGAFRPADGVHLGVAISLRGGGLIAPALHDADHRTLDELMAGLRDLVTRARTGRLRSSEMSDPTITVTNLGEQGVDLVHGVIYPPQVALVGFGDIRERPWAAGGMIGARPVVTATLAADHRASDGHAGSRFLDADRPSTAEAGGAMNERRAARRRDPGADRGRPGHRPGRDRSGDGPGRAAGHRLDGLPQHRRRRARADRDRDSRARLPEALDAR